MRRTAIVLASCIATPAVLAAAGFDLGLEPCFDDGVAVIGTYLDQSSEDEMVRLLASEQLAEYALGPCSNGGVSELYAGRVDEDAVGQGIAGRD